MKKLPFLLSTLFAAFSISANAQTITSTYSGTTVAVQEPGSSSDFINFFSGNYDYQGQTSINNVYVSNGTKQVLTSSLADFTINGGVIPDNTNGSYSVITTPTGDTFTTGDVSTTNGLAFAITPLDNGSTTGFNFDDFNVYLMISNTGGTLTDTTLSIDPRYYSFGTSPAFGTNDVAVTDNVITNQSGAEYIEFNIQGLGTADALARASNPSAGSFPDLVVSANFVDGTGTGHAYVGGVAFESAPEPSTYAMILGSLGLLGFCLRARRMARA